MVETKTAVRPKTQVVISICNGPGDAALTFKAVGWKDFNYPRNVTVEKSIAKLNIRGTTEPTEIFPLVGHVLDQRHAVTALTVEGIISIRILSDTIQRFSVGAERNDFYKVFYKLCLRYGTFLRYE